MKDNSCAVNFFHCYIPDGNQAIIKNNFLNYFPSKSETNLVTEFTKEEIYKAISMYYECDKLCYHKNLSVVNEVPKSFILINRKISPIDHRKTNRIERALYFLDLARQSSLNHEKISFYVCILECLFSAHSQNEIAHQISERTAMYFGGNEYFQLERYRLVKEAYSIRSGFFHGSLLKTNTKTLDLAFYLDNNIRTILERAILDDSMVFLQSPEDLDKSFLELIFRKKKSFSRVYTVDNEKTKKILKFKEQ